MRPVVYVVVCRHQQTTTAFTYTTTTSSRSRRHTLHNIYPLQPPYTTTCTHYIRSDDIHDNKSQARDLAGAEVCHRHSTFPQLPAPARAPR